MSEQHNKPPEAERSYWREQGDAEADPSVSAAIVAYYARERGLHHPIMNMTARGTLLPPRSGGVEEGLDDLQE